MGLGIAEIWEIPSGRSSGHERGKQLHGQGDEHKVTISAGVANAAVLARQRDEEDLHRGRKSSEVNPPDLCPIRTQNHPCLFS